MSKLEFITRTYNANDWWGATSAAESGYLFLNPDIYQNSLDRIKINGIVDPNGITVGIRSFYFGYGPIGTDPKPRAFQLGVMEWGLIEPARVSPDDQTSIMIMPYIQLKGHDEGGVTKPLIDAISAILAFDIIVQYESISAASIVEKKGAQLWRI